ncbi:hypothetical protein ACQ4PT_061055 [Festuca glaucescens]
MAVFEVDPTPWLPWGHEIIDGRPMRLPRTFYYASQDPPARHLSYCIALVELPPLPPAMALWREQVHDFLTGPLQRNVVTSQPSLFGVGLYQMSSPNSVNALVQHGQFQIQNRLLRFVHVGEAPQNHRAALGFRRGWLMFLGVHPDYRNDYDIAHAVATFGGVKESWTAPVYILTADFADALPADEDQMPPDGNPHPFLGKLQPNNNIFVNPQFPEIGWDAVENLGQDHQGDWNQMEEVQEVLEEMQESMVINMSDSSSSSVNMIEVQQQQGNMQMLYNVLNIGMVHTVIGPALPPEMVCAHALELVLPSLYGKLIPEAKIVSPFAFLKKLSGVSLSVIALDLGDKQHIVQSEPRLFTLSLPYREKKCVAEEEMGQQGGQLEVLDLTMSVTAKRRKVRKAATPLVQSSERRFTRSCLKTDGYRPKPILAVQPKIKKKTRARNLLMSMEKEAQ